MNQTQALALDWLQKALSSYGNYQAGQVTVNSATVEGIPAFYRAVSIRGIRLADLPFEALREIGTTRTKDYAHPGYKAWKNPNPFYGISTLIKTATGQRMGRGNAYIRVLRDLNASPLGLLLLDPDTTFPVFVNGELKYKSGYGRQATIFDSADVLHLKNQSSDGIIGNSIATVLKQALGAAIAHVEWEFAVYQNDATPGITVEFPRMFLDEEEKEQFIAGLGSLTGPKNANKLKILQAGAKLNREPLDLVSQQFLENKQFDLVTISNVTDVPPHLLGSSINSSYNSLELQTQSLIDNCLAGDIQSWEEEYNAKMRTEEEKATDSVVFEFNRKALTRSDQRTENDILTNKVNNGLITLNQYLQAMNLPTVPPEIGDVRRIPSNIQVLDWLEDENQEEEVSEEAGDTASPVSGNDLKGTVGGSQQVMQLQLAYSKGEISRPAAIANAVLLFGFSEAEAERLFPETVPEALTATPAPGPAPGEAPAPVAPAMREDTRLKALLSVDVTRLFNRIKKSPQGEHREVMIEALIPACPDIESHIDALLSEVREDVSVLNYPDKFVEKII